MANKSHLQARILFHNADYYGGGYYRTLMPAHLLAQESYATTLVHQMTYDEHSIKALAPDAIVFQHPTSDEEIQRVRMYKKALPNTPLIYEIDDLFWAVPEESAHFDAVPKDIKQRIIVGANLCTAAVVTTQPLKDVILKETKLKDVRVVPNRLSRETLDKMTMTRRRHNKSAERTKPRVGWVGGIGHGGDINFLRDIILEMKDEVDFVFMGLMPEGVSPQIVELHDNAPIGAYHEKLASLGLDLALAPLAPNTFNNCKSALRVLEYGACGYAVLASDCPAYDDFESVHLAPWSPAIWKQRIRELVAAPERLKKAGEELHEEVNRDHCMDEHLNEMLDAFTARKVSYHLPQRVEEQAAPVTVHDYMGMLKTFKEHPASPILWLAPDTHLADEDVKRMAEMLSQGGAVAAFSNDGIYPQSLQFTPVSDVIAEKIREACAAAGNGDKIAVPYPLGAAVMFSASALHTIGLPDAERFQDRDLALMDWGARAFKAGISQWLTPTVFAHVTKPPESAKQSQETLMAAQAWSPEFSNAMSNFSHKEAIDFACQNIELAFTRENYTHPLTSASYHDWFSIFGSLTPADKEKMNLSDGPKISVIMPVFDTNLAGLREAIASVEAQIYPRWELVIVDDKSTHPAIRPELERAAERDHRIKVHFRDENGGIVQASNDAVQVASGDWMVCLDHDDTLPDYALYAIAEQLSADPDLQFLYSDSDKIDDKGRFVDPYFVPDFDYDLLLAQNYVTHLSAYRLEAVKELGGFRAEYEGSQDWDMTLRYLTKTCGFPFDRSKIKHIPHVLYHWRKTEGSASANAFAKPYAIQNGRRAALDHLKETKQTASVQPHPLVPAFSMVRHLVPENAPPVSIIIQTRDNPDMLGKCINSIRERTAYANYEIIVMDNGWKKNALSKVADPDSVRLIANPGKFNYAAANNRGATFAKGEILCFLNDDIEIVEAAWLTDMVGKALRSWTGAVGPRLIYPNGSVQQAGIWIDMSQPVGKKAIHAFQRNHIQEGGAVGRGVLVAERSAITGACMVIRKDVYQEVGGMDEENFPRDYNDVDLCLRLLTHGYRTCYCGHIVVVHHEAQTKKRWASEHSQEAMKIDDEAFTRIRGGFVDPYLNPNLAFTPDINSIRADAAGLPWASADPRERVLVINLDHAGAVSFYQEGQLVICAALDGHGLVFNYPRMNRVLPIDTRDAPVDFLFCVQQLGIQRIVLNGVGDGTYGVLSFLQKVEEFGIPVEYVWRPEDKEEALPDQIKAYLWATATKMDIHAGAA